MLTDCYEISLQFITLFTLILQAYVVYLVETRSTRQMREYSYFLKLFLVSFLKGDGVLSELKLFHYTNQEHM
jgi:hypothetical protein